MEIKFFVIYWIAVFTTATYAEQFLYPIAQLDDANILVMHQTTSDDLELLVWNWETKIARKELTSLYIPAHVQLLPSKKAYSFLDRGRIRIKYFQKRAPKTIDIFQPICDIQSLYWITDEQCYFVARYRNYYKVFMYDLGAQGGSLYCLTNPDEPVNYIFPSKMGDRLFCLIQSEQGLYTIGHTPWNPVPFDAHNLSEHKDAYENCTPIIVHDHPLCFLSMHTQQLGFVLELLEKDFQRQVFTFGYCSVTLSNGQWEIQKLFDIILPENLVVGSTEDRLYESIYPLLPKYDQESHVIYFTNYEIEHQKCCVHQYDIATGDIKPCSRAVRGPQTHGHIFSPLVLEDKLYTGCSFNQSEITRSALHVNQINGIINCDMPVFFK